MGQRASRASFADTDEAVELLFLKAGKPRQLRPGQRLIKEGEVVDSVFLITGGELVLRKAMRRGTPSRYVGTRGKGTMIGELSFLLAQPATVSVEATMAGAEMPSVIEVCGTSSRASSNRTARTAFEG